MPPSSEAQRRIGVWPRRVRNGLAVTDRPRRGYATVNLRRRRGVQMPPRRRTPLRRPAPDDRGCDICRSPRLHATAGITSLYQLEVERLLSFQLVSGSASKLPLGSRAVAESDSEAGRNNSVARPCRRSLRARSRGVLRLVRPAFGRGAKGHGRRWPPDAPRPGRRDDRACRIDLTSPAGTRLLRGDRQRHRRGVPRRPRRNADEDRRSQGLPAGIEGIAST